MGASGPFPSAPPAYVEVSRYPLPLSFSCATHQSIVLRFAAKKTASYAFFFFKKISSEVLDLWPGLVCSPSCHYKLAFIGSRAKCLFSLHCWELKMGGTLVYLWVGPLRCVQRKNCPLHTVDWQALPRVKTSPTWGPWIPAAALLFWNTTLLSLNSCQCCAMRFWG